MSVITEILDRLSGIAIVRERVTESARRVESLSDRVLDHERRLIRIETLLDAAPVPPPRRLTKK